MFQLKELCTVLRRIPVGGRHASVAQYSASRAESSKASDRYRRTRSLRPQLTPDRARAQTCGLRVRRADLALKRNTGGVVASAYMIGSCFETFTTWPALSNFLWKRRENSNRCSQWNRTSYPYFLISYSSGKSFKKQEINLITKFPLVCFVDIINISPCTFDFVLSFW